MTTMETIIVIARVTLFENFQKFPLAEKMKFEIGQKVTHWLVLGVRNKIYRLRSNGIRSKDLTCSRNSAQDIIFGIQSALKILKPELLKIHKFFSELQNFKII